jgi:hypothetical protein
VKAGLIGAAAAVVLALLGLIPCLGCVTSLLALVVYAGAGVLTAIWMESPLDAGKAAGGGAVAGAIAALGGGITSVITSLTRFTVGGGRAAMMRQFQQLPPEIRESWRDLGFDPTMLANPGWAAGASTLCCGLGLLLAAALGAAAGAITASIRRGSQSSL